MELVVDANILFAILIRQGKTAEILVNPLFKVYAPEFFLEELLFYKQEILSKTHRSESDFNDVLNLFNEIIHLIPNYKTFEFLDKAREICPDEKDLEYFALALKLNCAVWSNDKVLKQQNKVIVYSTEDLVNEFGF